MKEIIEFDNEQSGLFTNIIEQMGTIPAAEAETNVKTPAAYFISDNDIPNFVLFQKSVFSDF